MGMTLSKAIEIHTDTYHQYEKHLLSDQRDAFKLSIEAMKEVKEARLMSIGSRLPHTLLPGETKD